MNVLQVNPDGTRDVRVIPSDWAHEYLVPVREPFSVFRDPPDDPSRSTVKTLRYRNTGLETDGHLIVFLTDAHQLDVARVEMAFPTGHEPRTSAETKLRNEMIEFLRERRIDRKDVLAERIVEIPTPNAEPPELLYALRLEWVTLKSVS